MKIAVARGKGGTGKTTVATSLALALRDIMPVQVLDCDVESPNAHLFLHPKINRREKVTVLVPVVDQEACIHCGECAKICMYHAIAAVSNMVFAFPDLCHSCGGCELVCPTRAIIMEEREIGVVEYGKSGGLAFTHGKLNVGTPLSPPVIRAVKAKANALGAVIIDAPPGTACPEVTSVEGADFCLLVTEPTRFGLNDLELAVSTVRALGVPLGVVIN